MPQRSERQSDNSQGYPVSAVAAWLHGLDQTPEQHDPQAVTEGRLPGLRARALIVGTTALMVVASACSSSAPDPTPLPTSAASPPPINAELPDPRCPGPPGAFPADVNTDEDAGPTILVPVFDLPCDGAVDAANSALPADRPSIAAIEFHYGDYCPPGVFCDVVDWTAGYVVFYAAGDGDDIWIRVRGSGGHVRVIGDPEPYPPTAPATVNG